ncbi:UDP-N-acetylglucosamine--N-acetylmuramyl-(pentapeptide) pyrophosphoryl-undecaprenol N-acetylglucosamine transferase [Candidatus Dojkabacteria bacterium]|jgi:UDP-N-acetylglucosamine--N-acetylmuramyl-(pentapeptide) pyrophosphoryl-undecaprenol N-acetylglucosamine transferase|nr:UDP-N-acetylglucosamine--N-acetylmuramyl-(pentapeptide) pyrophosphoryl-undecaprenol N-acetylglucosamine transferase [Candidatus Dojkabacteria bacterium]
MQKKILNKKIILTGGGSGGHVSIISSIIKELSERYSNVEEMVLYIGGDLGMVGEKDGKSAEMKMMEGSNIKFKTIRAGKLQRIFAFSTIALLFRSILGVFDSFKYIKEFKPDLIISSGGYVSVPITLVAKIKKIPLYLHEQTSAIGLSNSFGSKVAKKVFVAFKESLEFFPKGKTYVVGNPVRDCIFKTDGRTELTQVISGMKVKRLPIIYITGGSLGSHIINLTIRESLIHLLSKYQVILQTGDNKTFMDYDVLHTDWKKLPEDLQERLYITKYVTESEIGNIFANCNFVIGRSGANTVYELGILRKPCILIPIPWVTHNEQERNAKILEDLGLAYILHEGELSREKLIKSIDEFNDTYHMLVKKLDQSKFEEIFIKNATAKMLDMIPLDNV